MKRNVIFGSFILVVLLLSSCASLNKGDREEMNYVNIKEDTDDFEVEISYPEFKHFPHLNEAIEEEVSKEWVALKNEEKSDFKKEFKVTSDVVSSRGIVSVLLTFYKINGGANGETNIKIFNYDTNNKQFLDVLTATGYTLDELSVLTKDALLKPFNGDEFKDVPKENILELKALIEEGTKPDIRNFENFAMKDDFIIIYFAPGKVGPYSDGVDFVLLPHK